MIYYHREHFLENSSIFEHISSCNACYHSTIENFNILSHGSNDYDNKIIEAVSIKKQKPILSNNLHQHGASFLLKVL